MSTERDRYEPADWDAGWDQATFWQRHAQTSPAEPFDTTRVIQYDLPDEPETATAPRRGRRRSVFRALVYPLISLGAALARGLSRAGSRQPPAPGRTQSGFNRVAVAMLIVVVASVTLVSFSGLPNMATYSTPGSAVEPPPGEAPVLTDPSSTPPAADTPAPEKTSAQPTTSPQPSATPQPTDTGRERDEGYGAGQPATVRSSARPANRTTTPPEFRFSSQVTGKSFGVAANSTADGARMVQIGADEPSTRYRLVDVGDGFFNIINANGRALDNPGGSPDRGTPMQQWTLDKGNPNQQWRFVSVGDAYLVINRASGLALDLRDGDTGDGAVIQQWTAERDNPNQHWRLVRAN
ncbi:MAG: RICIN domain-containing protein [Micromonosporaceae bacterium]